MLKQIFEFIFHANLTYDDDVGKWSKAGNSSWQNFS